MDYPILDQIHSTKDVQGLCEERIPALCEEIRAFLIHNVTKTGGHLASNLGVTELTVALHRVFDSPKDKIVFDVGHQSYVHKLLTGRAEHFSKLRMPGGLSGFTTRLESEHDPFGAGHSSTSISAALGFAEAERIRGGENYAVAVVGDGAFTGGMIHEALNNCKSDLRLVIVLNENRMSISKNKGAFASYLSRVRSSRGYHRWKSGTKRLLGKLPLFGKPLRRVFAFVKNRIKSIVYTPNYFEQLGLYYVGPVNGNDYKSVEKALREARALERCVVVHVKTKKGKGYEPAERSPDVFHSIYCKQDRTDTFHSVFAEELIREAAEDSDITAVTAAMGIGTGLDAFGAKFSERYFDVGIAEEHALTFSAGLAAAGLKPYAVIYSTFLQRAYDNILHDIALQGLPVRIIIDRAGLAHSDGPTHHGIFDVSFLSGIPGIRILAPVTYGSLVMMMQRMKDTKEPTALRYSNIGEKSRVVSVFYPEGDYESFGVRASYSKLFPPENVIITYGRMVENALLSLDLLKQSGIEAGILLLETLAPYDETAEAMLPYLNGVRHILFVEEGIYNGGAAMILEQRLRALGALRGIRFECCAIFDTFAVPDTPRGLYEDLGMSPEGIAARFMTDGLPNADNTAEN